MLNEKCLVSNEMMRQPPFCVYLYSTVLHNPPQARKMVCRQYLKSILLVLNYNFLQTDRTTRANHTFDNGDTYALSISSSMFIGIYSPCLKRWADV